MYAYSTLSALVPSQIIFQNFSMRMGISPGFSMQPFQTYSPHLHIRKVSDTSQNRGDNGEAKRPFSTNKGNITSEQ